MSCQWNAQIIIIIQKHLMKCILSDQTFEENENDSNKILSNCIDDNGMFVCQKCKDGYYPKLNDKLEGFMHQIVQTWVLCFMDN